MQDFLLLLLAFLCCLRGITCASWAVNVMPHVNGSAGQAVVLPSFFTHPKQNSYTGGITVRWLQYLTYHPVFHCSLRNQTNGPERICSDPSSPKRFWLHGNPRKGDVSLFINSTQFNDTKHYICRVELDYDSYQSNRIQLNITAPAQILSLAPDSEATAQGVMLKCIAQGNPVPTVKWTSSNGSLGSVPLSKTDHSNYTVTSWIPFSGRGVYTCRALNSLGQGERTFPPNDDFGLWVWISAVGCFLFLGLFVVVGVVIIRRRFHVQRDIPQNVYLQNKICIDQENEAPIYSNVNCYHIGGGARRVVPEIPVTGLDEPVYVDTYNPHNLSTNTKLRQNSC